MFGPHRLFRFLTYLVMLISSMLIWHSLVMKAIAGLAFMAIFIQERRSEGRDLPMNMQFLRIWLGVGFILSLYVTRLEGIDPAIANGFATGAATLMTLFHIVHEIRMVRDNERPSITVAPVTT